MTRESPSPVPIVLSVEQALAMPYATLRFVHLGWRVIRVEATPTPGRRAKGDPNRSIGRPVAGDDRHSYFVGPNVGKEAIAIDLKIPAGRELLHAMVRRLPVDVFCTNTLPAHHRALGIDFETLREVKPDLIWAGISALGTASPRVPGYDPMIQALCGFMDLTGDPDGPPMQCGPPIIDLKAGDEVFAQVLLALRNRDQRAAGPISRSARLSQRRRDAREAKPAHPQRANASAGACIDISMAQVAASWLLTFLPMLDMGSPPSELRRSGNEHRQFIPTNAYHCADGFVYMALGSDAQWERFVAEPLFASLAGDRYATNEGRRADKKALHAAIAAIMRAQPVTTVMAALEAAQIPHAPISAIEDVMELPFLAAALLHTRAPDGRNIRLPPPAVTTPFLEDRGGVLPFAPRYGEHSDALLEELGISPADRAALRAQGVVA